ncbi:hypothetical protein ACQ5SO_20915 [Rhodovulum sp. DZ06]|uniref:hypothetical protein n=1 Tax=Rhodovulum sp. DZ06 TaxID=3425126 RepID=UPI003D32698C
MSHPDLTLLDRIMFLLRPVAQVRRISHRCAAYLRRDGYITVKHVHPGNVQYHRLDPTEARELAAALQELADEADRRVPPTAEGR